jgi:hypothetical protein
VRLYTSGDGGVFAQDADAGGYDNQSWEFANVGYTTTSRSTPVMGGDGTIYAGQQDNGTLKVEPGEREAKMVLGGDGVDVAVDPTTATSSSPRRRTAPCARAPTAGAPSRPRAPTSRTRCSTRRSSWTRATRCTS